MFWVLSLYHQLFFNLIWFSNKWCTLLETIQWLLINKMHSYVAQRSININLSTSELFWNGTRFWTNLKTRIFTSFRHLQVEVKGALACFYRVNIRCLPPLTYCLFSIRLLWSQHRKPLGYYDHDAHGVCCNHSSSLRERHYYYWYRALFLGARTFIRLLLFSVENIKGYSSSSCEHFCQHMFSWKRRTDVNCFSGESQ